MIETDAYDGICIDCMNSGNIEAGNVYSLWCIKYQIRLIHKTHACHSFVLKKAEKKSHADILMSLFEKALEKAGEEKKEPEESEYEYCERITRETYRLNKQKKEEKKEPEESELEELIHWFDKKTHELANECDLNAPDSVYYKELKQLKDSFKQQIIALVIKKVDGVFTEQGGWHRAERLVKQKLEGM